MHHSSPASVRALAHARARRRSFVMLKIVVATSLAALVTGFSTVPKTPMGDEMIDEGLRKLRQRLRWRLRRKLRWKLGASSPGVASAWLGKLRLVLRYRLRFFVRRVPMRPSNRRYLGMQYAYWMRRLYAKLTTHPRGENPR